MTSPDSPISSADSDLALVERANAGDTRAFELLVIKYQRRIERLVGRMVRDVEANAPWQRLRPAVGRQVAAAHGHLHIAPEALTCVEFPLQARIPGGTISVAETFDLAPAEVMMVAAHQDDLAAARACGLQTAYIERPLEFGAAQPKDVSPDPANTWHAKDLLALAEQLGC